jgi:GNAT superfamily N-acetyltransferase
VSVSIRPAVPADSGLIARFIMDLAVYEKLQHEVKAGEAEILRDFFGAAPRVFCDIAEWNGEPVGFAVWFYSYSTFQGRHGIWLEDLYVDPIARGRGIGKALLEELARRCVAEELGRLEWWVLDWNAPSVEFYRSRGAVLQDDWTRCRVDGDALRRLGGA